MPSNGASSSVTAAPVLTFPVAPAPPAPVPVSWLPVDLTSIFAGGLVTPITEVLARTDGFQLFYRGKVNNLIGESESGKTWVALLAVVQEIKKGNRVVFVDYEDSPTALAIRLTAMGLTQTQLTEQFVYLQPSEPINDEAKLLWAPIAGAATLVVIDGVTEVMSIEGLKVNDMEDVAKFYRNIPKWFANQGVLPAVVLIDHVTKAKDDRGTFAIGSQHKKAGIDGASYTVQKDQEFARGKHGTAWIKIAKDKNGTVRAKADKTDVGKFHLDSSPTTGMCDAWIDLPNAPALVAVSSASGAMRNSSVPASQMQAYLNYVKLNPGSSGAGVAKGCGGKTEVVHAAVKELTHSGFLLNTGSDARPKYNWVRDYDVPAPPGLEDV